MSQTQFDRRVFLHQSAAALTGLAATAGYARGAKSTSVGYGELSPVKDETTGLPLIQLPPGFRYLSFGWTGTKLDDGRKTPGAHDGMAVVKTEGDLVTLVRNHEIDGNGKPMGAVEQSYDPRARGGCTNLVFDTAQGKLVKSWVSLSGTVRNCAGGLTPWGTWLTCEEATNGPDESLLPKLTKGFDETHGWIFEVPAEGVSNAEPLKAMGRFRHEAVAIDPMTGQVYETEDKDKAGLFRFTPKQPGKLAAGGKLEMLKVDGEPDLRFKSKSGTKEFNCSWVEIAEPELAHVTALLEEQGCFTQGKRLGGTTFARLEGAWYGQGNIYFTATSGGTKKAGQVWEYHPQSSKLRLVYDSPGIKILDYPDNLTVSTRGGMLLCENGGAHPQRVLGLTPQGQLFPFAENNCRITKPVFGIKGNFAEQEWAGATFTPDGKWMFVNIQVPGITLAITGPWEEGAL